jgi:hypothetical protein
VDVNSLNPDLRAMLVCPVDRQPLRDEPEALICTACGRRYPIVDGIPNMIPDDEKLAVSSEQ